MPTYEYVCEASGWRFEKFQRMSEEPLKECPSCGGPARRLISAGGAVILKGGGSPAGTRCGRNAPCCGREVRCDKPPCEE